MTNPPAISYEITLTAVADAIRVHQATLISRYRIATLALAVAGLLFSIVVDLSLGITLMLLGLVLFAMTWMQFLDRWLYRTQGRGVIGGNLHDPR